MTAMTVTLARPSELARRSQPRESRGPIRLTRRGRLVVVLAVLVGGVLGFSLEGSSASQAGSTPTHHARPAVVTVQTGESLWQLATRVAPHADPRLVVGDIERLNRLSSATVYAGQQLEVPRYR